MYDNCRSNCETAARIVQRTELNDQQDQQHLRITQSTVSDIVNGTTTNTGIATIKKLCDGFDISVRTFFDSPLFDDLEQEVR